MIPLFDAYRRFVLSSQVRHVDETPVSMLDSGAGKTKRVYVWAYAKGAFDEVPRVPTQLNGRIDELFPHN